ncbi:MAG TPA: Eco57I restriction-modification methylase domain-containing protein [Spirochaetota bacterium]|nr:Eco57I restriction-modification methylase domain-containing protein [Spirochaetota bacterium]
MYSKEQSKIEITKLVEQFEKDLPAIVDRGVMDEAKVEDTFIKPLFLYLNWNIHNVDLPYKEHEFIVQYRLKHIGLRPDYLLRVKDESINKMRHVLFIEAKHPKYNLAKDLTYIRQCYLYANSTLCKTEKPERRVNLSLLTDFEEFRLFDCRDRAPLKSNEVQHFNKRVIKDFDWNYHNYISDFNTLWDVFEKGQVTKGSLREFSISDEELKDSRKAPDFEMLAILRDWRKEIAQDIYRNDKTLTENVLTAASQLMINRIIFIKMLTDKELEKDYLSELLIRIDKSDDEISFYDECKDIFNNLQTTYNGSIFEKRIELDSVKVSNKTLKTILQSLRPENSIYSLDAMPVHVIGTMYEKFLGEIICKKGRGVSPVLKPDVKKAGGVYYTPAHIVDYIVDNTVGIILKNCTKPEDVSKIKICDPACGSGSFLIAVYDKLINWHIEYYFKLVEKLLDKGENFDSINKKHRNDFLIQLLNKEKSNYKIILTIKKKKEILTNSIYGVDIDEQAVEVTRFSLSMKAVEDYDDHDELYNEVNLFHSSILPDLKNNIKCGNSLIDEDYFEQVKLKDSDFSIDYEIEERRRINPFNWEKNFPSIFANNNKGFDVIIGNPPYYSIDDTWGSKDSRLSYVKSKYPEIYNDKTDILFYFFKKAIDISKEHIGFIVSRAFLEAYKANKLRGFISQKKSISQIIDFRNYYIFEGVGITSCITILTNKNDSPAIIRQYIGTKNDSLSLDNFDNFNLLSYPQSYFKEQIWSFADNSTDEIIQKIDSISEPLENILIIGKGMETGLNNVYSKRQHDEIEKWKLKKGSFFIRARNSDIDRYHIANSEEYVIYLENFQSFDNIPTGLKKFMKENENELKARAAYKRGDCEWWKFTWPLHKDYHDRVKIYSPYMAQYNRFALDENNTYLGLTDTTVLFDNEQPEDIKFILGLLNSKLLTFRFRFMSKLKSGGIYEYFWNNISKIPIKRIDLNNQDEKELHDKIVTSVQRIIELKVRQEKEKSEYEKNKLNDLIIDCDNLIDENVFKLYNLTTEEIDFVINSTQ